MKGNTERPVDLDHAIVCVRSTNPISSKRSNRMRTAVGVTSNRSTKSETVNPLLAPQQFEHPLINRPNRMRNDSTPPDGVVIPFRFQFSKSLCSYLTRTASPFGLQILAPRVMKYPLTLAGGGVQF